MPPVDRLGFLSDMFACSKFGFCAISLCLDLASCFENEDTLAVIQELSSNLAEVLSVYKNDATIVQALRTNLHSFEQLRKKTSVFGAQLAASAASRLES